MMTKATEKEFSVRRNRVPFIPIPNILIVPVAMRIHWNARWIQFWHRLTFPVRFIRNSAKYANDNNNADHVENETDLSHIVFNDDNTGKHWIIRKSCRRHWSRHPIKPATFERTLRTIREHECHDERKARRVCSRARGELPPRDVPPSENHRGTPCLLSGEPGQKAVFKRVLRICFSYI